MSFSQLESSLDQGQPVRLYSFSRGVFRWLYCTTERDVTVQTQTFRAVSGGISDSGLKLSGETRSDTLTITAPADISVAQLFRSFPPSEPVGLSIFDMHYGDDEARLSWSGRINTVQWAALDRCRIKCVTRESEMGEPGLTDVYMRTCTAVLGDHRCRVEMSAHRLETLVQSMDGQSIYSGAFEAYPDGWFTAGYIEWPIGNGEFERRHIERHIGSQLSLMAGTAGVPSGLTVRVYPGCDFMAQTCRDKFNNDANFRGIPHLQGESPFDGDQVW